MCVCVYAREHLFAGHDAARRRHRHTDTQTHRHIDTQGPGEEEEACCREVDCAGCEEARFRDTDVLWWWCVCERERVSARAYAPK